MAEPSCFCTCNRKSIPKVVITLVGVDTLKGVDELNEDVVIDMFNVHAIIDGL
jgi:hypothetical protein